MVRWERLLLASGVVAGVVAASGCAAPVAPRERQGSTTSRLGAPKPAVKTPASKATKDQFGIVEWRIFRSKKDLFMTGYDAKGKAVKGLSAGFDRSEADGEDVVRTKINDGSDFTAVHGLTSHRNVANAPPSADNAAFMQAAFVDASKTNLAFRADLQSAAANDGSECGADVTAIVTQALACTQGGAVSKTAQAACIAAAKKAAETSAACKGTTDSAPPAPAEGESFDPDAPELDPDEEDFDHGAFGDGGAPDAVSLLETGVGAVLGADPFGSGDEGDIAANALTGAVDWTAGSGEAGGLHLGGWLDFGGTAWTSKKEAAPEPKPWGGFDLGGLFKDIGGWFGGGGGGGSGGGGGAGGGGGNWGGGCW